ncbi:anthranilate phosphoribosyltransferase [Halotalea alkalilenta]|uniref:Anthranilate phosphoribosyltransferase n=1 Tax=Halotalea alkalilenta TaxID=376489 RepID=A0A172YHX7_9GAMM|nr:anthranilate phosphoribosyltransferase [Halotalea alkalilenta]ANF58766.1 anthranilate phosphoribosyltransferase [Halotalea alkalilenta]
MNIREALKALIQGRDLDYSQMHAVMSAIMTGEASEAQIGALLTALAIKGESSVEITAAAQVMRELMLKVEVSADHLVDIVGTGGDGANLFNVSTAASFVVAAAGATVAKHGNRGVSSSSGSADLLDAAGLHLDLDAEQVARCIEEVGVGFMFAPVHHKAMRYAIGPRRDMGVRTIFNILGPLTNPAGVRRQLIGVYERALAPVVADAFRQLGSVHTLVVHAEDGLDEISLAAPTSVCELKDGEIREYQITPERFGIERQPLDPLKVDGTAQSLALVESALNDEPGPARDMVALNAGAALYVAGRAESLEEGVALAKRTLAGLGALDKLRELAAFTQRLAAGA